MKKAVEPISKPVIEYRYLTEEYVHSLSPIEAEEVVVGLLAEKARVKEGGLILSFSEFNENPDPLVNRLLARIIVSRINPEIFEGFHTEKIAVLSIENSAGYLASEVTRELQERLQLARPPRIIRARKSPDGKVPSPAMGEYQAHTTVTPITSQGVPRHLIASMSDGEDLKRLKVIIAVDDFLATGNSIRGGIDLALQLMRQSGADLEKITIVPVAGLGKPEQATDQPLHSSDVRIEPIATAVDVRFWPDHNTGQVLIQANSFQPYVMHNATIGNFTT